MSAVLFLLAVSFDARAHAPKFHNPSCMVVTKACEAGGYKSKPKDGQGHLMDCLNKLLAGEDVDGVRMQAADPKVAKCKEKAEAWDTAHHHHRRGKATDNQLQTMPKNHQEGTAETE